MFVLVNIRVSENKTRINWLVMVFFCFSDRLPLFYTLFFADFIGVSQLLLSCAIKIFKVSPNFMFSLFTFDFSRIINLDFPRFKHFLSPKTFSFQSNSHNSNIIDRKSSSSQKKSQKVFNSKNRHCSVLRAQFCWPQTTEVLLVNGSIFVLLFRFPTNPIIDRECCVVGILAKLLGSPSLFFDFNNR
jgi:hypothetical protein